VDQSQSFVGLSPLSNPHDLYRAGDRQRNQRKLLTNTAGLEYDHSTSKLRLITLCHKGFKHYSTFLGSLTLVSRYFRTIAIRVD